MSGLKVPTATTVTLSLHYPALTVRVLEQVADYIRKQHGIEVEDSTVADDIARQIREQIQPPRPAEPTGLAALVERADGGRWVLGPQGWTNLHATGRYLNWCTWEHVNELSPVVRVLSEGVTS